MGARRFGSAGNLCVDDVYSLEQFVIDAWIARHAVHTVEAGLSSAVMADLGGFFEELAAVMSGDNILGQPSTLEVMNAFRRSHTGFEHMKLREWQGGGSRAMRNKAREIITAKLAEPHFVLDPAKASELNRVYAAAEKALG